MRFLMSVLACALASAQALAQPPGPLPDPRLDERPTRAPAQQPEIAPLSVTSSAFGTNESIPVEFTCDGTELSPPLAWTNVPREAKSIAILVEDPDAPGGTFTHWLVTGIPGTANELAAGTALPEGAIASKTDAGKRGWTGPCPPSGRHRYVFQVYALDIPLARALTPATFRDAIRGHVVGYGSLVGTYQRRP